MKSVLIMSMANIRKRKMQSTLMGITLFMAALLLATAISMLQGMEDPVARMFERQKGSHITMMMPTQSHQGDEIVSWWASQKGVEGVVQFPYYMAEDDFKHNGKKQFMGGIMLSEHPNQPLKQDQLHIAEGPFHGAPGKGEVWVPTGYAYSWGIQVGDTLEVLIDGVYKSFNVSAIVVDPQFSPSLMNPVRAWVTAGFFAEHGKEGESRGSLIGVRLSDHLEYNKLWQDFEAYLEAPYMGFVFEYQFIKNIYSMVQNMLAIIMLAFAGIIIVVSMLVLGFTIANGVMTDCKTIGILKVQGFSPQHIKWIYSLQYLFLAVIAAPLGILASRYVAGMVMLQMSKTLGIASPDLSMALPGMVTLLTILPITGLFSLLASTKAGGVKPVEAIRNAGPSLGFSRKRQLSFRGISALPIPVMLAIKSIFSSRRQSGFLLVSAMVMAFVMTFSVNTFYSVKNMAENYAYWGFDDADVYLSANVSAKAEANPGGSAKEHARAEIMSILHGDERVQSALPYQVFTDAAIPAQGGYPSKNVVGFMYDGDMDTMGILNLVGDNPQGSEEVAISYMAAQQYGKTVGDSIVLYLGGQKTSLRVTGIYQCVSAMGWGIRLQEEVLHKIDPAAYAGNYSVKLKEEKEAGAFVEDMKALFGEAYSIRIVSESGEINLSQITGSIGLVALLLSLVFAIVAFIIIFNTITMEIYRDKKNLGIYSAMGMTSTQLRLTVLWKSLMLSGGGVLLGIALGLLLSPHLLGIFIGNLGMARFPFDITVPGTLLVIPVCIGIVVISTWLPAGKVLKIRPRALVME